MVREVEYWHAYRRSRASRRRHRAFADIWRERPELFVEVKLAGRWGAHHHLGRDTQRTLESYADDVWRLTVLAPRHRPRTRTSSSLVGVAFSDHPMPVRLPALPPRKIAKIASDADVLHDALIGLSSAPDPLAAFLGAVQSTGARLHRSRDHFPAIDRAGLVVSCWALTWTLAVPWETGWQIDRWDPNEGWMPR